jgi:cysteine synthase
MIEAAEAAGQIGPGMHIIEPASGTPGSLSPSSLPAAAIA